MSGISKASSEKQDRVATIDKVVTSFGLLRNLRPKDSTLVAFVGKRTHAKNKGFLCEEKSFSQSFSKVSCYRYSYCLVPL